MCYTGILVLLQVEQYCTGSRYSKGKILHTKTFKGIEPELFLKLVLTGLWYKRPLIHCGDIIIVAKTLPETALVPLLQHHLFRGKI